MGRHFSDELFHLVGRDKPEDDERCFQSLVAVLRDGWISHPPHAKEWGPIRLTYNPTKSLVHGDLVVPEMICFCDIPAEHLQDHVAKYGRFGLSIDKNYAIRYGTRPVTYLPMRSDDRFSPYGTTMAKEIEATYRGFLKHIVGPLGDGERPSKFLTHEPVSPIAAVDATHSVFLKDFLAFLKPFDSELPEKHRDYFYAEKEWRRLGNMKIAPEHVRHLVAAKGFAERLSNAAPDYAAKPILTPGRSRPWF